MSHPYINRSLYTCHYVSKASHKFEGAYIYNIMMCVHIYIQTFPSITSLSRAFGFVPSWRHAQQCRGYTGLSLFKRSCKNSDQGFGWNTCLCFSAPTAQLADDESAFPQGAVQKFPFEPTTLAPNASTLTPNPTDEIFFLKGAFKNC